MTTSRVVMITGATGGLGQEISRRFGRSGCRIAVHYHRNRETADKLSADLQRLGSETMIVQSNVCSFEETRAATQEVVTRWDRLDVLISTVGIRQDGLLLRLGDAEWDNSIKTNLTGVRNSLKAAGGIFLKQKEGHVITLGSYGGVHGSAGQVNYAASKAGLIGLIRSVAREWGPANVKLNLVFPGLQPTSMTQGLSADRVQEILLQNILGRSTPAQEVAEFIYHLSGMTGVSAQIFNLDSRIF